MVKTSPYIVLTLLFLGLILTTLPVLYPEYGINEFKKNIFIFYLTPLAIVSFFFLLLKPKLTSGGLTYITLILILILVYNSVRAFFISNFEIKSLFPIWAATIYYLFLSQSLKYSYNVTLVRKIFFYSVLVCVIIQLVVGVMQLSAYSGSYNTYYDITGTFDNPNYYCIFLAGGIVFLGTSVFYSRPTNKFIIWSISLICTITGFFLFYIFCRSALIGVFVASAFFLWMTPSLIKFKFKKKLIIYILAPLSIIFFVILYFIKRDSADGRVVIWKISKDIVSDHFILGIGYNKFPFDYNVYQAKYFDDHSWLKQTEGYYVDYTESTLSDFYQILCEQGIIGLILIVFLVLVIAYYIRKISTKTVQNTSANDLSFSKAASYGAITLFVSSQFTDTFGQFPTLLLLYSFIAIIEYEVGVLGVLNSQANTYKSLVVVNITAILIGIGMSWHIYKFHTVLTNLNREIKSSNISNVRYMPLDSKYFLNNKIENLVNLVPTTTLIKFLENCKMYTSYWKVYLTLGSAYLDQGDYKNAKTNLLIAHNMIPHLVYPKYMLAKMYFANNEKEKWNQMAIRVLTEKEKIPSREVNLMRNEIEQMLIEEKNTKQ